MTKQEQEHEKNPYRTIPYHTGMRNATILSAILLTCLIARKTHVLGNTFEDVRHVPGVKIQVVLPVCQVNAFRDKVYFKTERAEDGE